MLFIVVLSTVAMVVQAGGQVPNKCVMKFSDFKTKVQGKDWITLYAFDDMQAGGPLKEHSIYTILPNDSMVAALSEWNEPDRHCQYISYSVPLTTYGMDKDRTELQGFGDIVVRFVSSYPDEYIMENVCWDGPLCTVSSNSVKVIDQRTDATCLTTGSDDIILNQVPWDDIADDLFKCYGRKFKEAGSVSPPVEWVWKGRTECPPPPAS